MAGCCVHFQVFLQITLNLELLVTDATNKDLALLSASMCSRVFQIQGPVSKLLITDMALEWFVASVNPYVLQQVGGSVTGLGTVSANVSLLLVCVFFHVVSQVTLVPPALATQGALEGAKSRVTGLAVVPESLQVYEFDTTLWAGMGPSLIFFLF